MTKIKALLAAVVMVKSHQGGCSAPGNQPAPAFWVVRARMARSVNLLVVSPLMEKHAQL